MATLAHATHATLMDGVYRYQRHIYDATRKFFLFGRDRLIGELNVPAGGHVLEVGCGTGRNLARIARAYPTARLYGLDISAEMLKSANANLGQRAVLARGDATCVDPEALFGRAQFERVVISFALSMIPDWQAALVQACTLITPGGEVHIVDFGDGAGLARPLRWALGRWLAAFHVSPRTDLAPCAAALVGMRGFTVTCRSGPYGYYQQVIVSRG